MKSERPPRDDRKSSDFSAREGTWKSRLFGRNPAELAGREIFCYGAPRNSRANLSRGARLVALSIGALFALTSLLRAAPFEALPALAGDHIRVESAKTGRPYHVFVRLPADYATSGKIYPTVYLLDGDSLFPILGALHLFLTYDEPIPEAIVVGVAYGSFDPAVNKRDVDYRAPATDEDARGGAAKFQAFLGDELIREIERRYRSDPARRVLVGQSHGGQFALYSALTAPDMFWGRIVSNPSMKPNVGFFYAPARTARSRDLKLFLASGSRDREPSRAQALKWSAAWADRKKPWALRFETIEGGTHAASIAEAYRRGLLWLFAVDGAGGDPQP